MTSLSVATFLRPAVVATGLAATTVSACEGLAPRIVAAAAEVAASDFDRTMPRSVRDIDPERYEAVFAESIESRMTTPAVHRRGNPRLARELEDLLESPPRCQLQAIDELSAASWAAVPPEATRGTCGFVSHVLFDLITSADDPTPWQDRVAALVASAPTPECRRSLLRTLTSPRPRKIDPMPLLEALARESDCTAFEHEARAVDAALAGRPDRVAEAEKVFDAAWNGGRHCLMNLTGFAGDLARTPGSKGPQHYAGILEGLIEEALKDGDVRSVILGWRRLGGLKISSPSIDRLARHSLDHPDPYVVGTAIIHLEQSRPSDRDKARQDYGIVRIEPFRLDARSYPPVKPTPERLEQAAAWWRQRLDRGQAAAPAQGSSPSAPPSEAEGLAGNGPAGVP